MAITIQRPVVPMNICASPAVAKPVTVVINAGIARKFRSLFLPEKNHLVGPLRAFLDLHPLLAAFPLGDSASHWRQA